MQKKSYPVTNSLKSVETLSIIIAALMAAASLSALLFPAALYASEETRQAMLTNDVVNLVIGVPTIIACLLLHRRERLIGLLFWPGALLYVTYNSLAATVAFPSWFLFIVHLTLTALSTAALALLLPRMDMPAIKKRLAGKVPERFAGTVLALFGVAFFFLALSILFGGETGRSEIATATADLVVAPFWTVSGIQLLRRKPFGYAIGAGMLFHAAT
ncbi:MAG: hypothetical protein RBT34_09145, partial [Anaerolineaceae bacterium]|nr:hypothetical protein [Anaerolineaceae bacterium]